MTSQRNLDEAHRETHSTMKLIAVYTTVGSQDDARKLANALVERKLVACAQISAIESFYSWQGAVQNDQEFRILLKTTEARYHAVEATIRELHTYELPAIHTVAFEHADERYATWIEQGCTGE